MESNGSGNVRGISQLLTTFYILFFIATLMRRVAVVIAIMTWTMHSSTSGDIL